MARQAEPPRVLPDRLDLVVIASAEAIVMGCLPIGRAKRRFAFPFPVTIACVSN